MKKGTDTNKLFVDQKQQEITIDFAGEEWDFTVRQLTWKEKQDCILSAQKIDVSGSKQNPIKSIKVDSGSYNITYLMKAIIKAPFPMTMASFLKLDGDFGDLLVDAIIKDEGDADFMDLEEQ